MSQKASKSSAVTRGKEKASASGLSSSPPPPPPPPLQVVRLDELQGTVEQLVARATATTLAAGPSASATALTAGPSASGTSGEWGLWLFGIVVHAVGRVVRPSRGFVCCRRFCSRVFVLLTSVLFLFLSLLFLRMTGFSPLV